MGIFFTSDLHFGHKNIIGFDGRPFTSVEEMDAAIVQNWNERVGADDLVYVLGDISWYGAGKTEALFNSLNGKKVLIRGNHDGGNWLETRGMFERVSAYEVVVINGEFLTLSHFPMPFYDRQHYDAYMLYGHVHNSHEWNFIKSYQRGLHELDIKCKMCNVGCMVWDYRPVTLEEIKDRIEKWGCA